MSQVYPLDRVIRRVDSGYATFAPAERVIIIDAKRRSIVPKKPFLPFGDLRYYVLLTSNDARNVATGQINGFQLQDLSYTLPVSISWEVRCRPGNEMRVALALFDDIASPGEILERAITRWLVELGQAFGIFEFVRNYVDNRAALEAKFSSKALIEMGLDLNARLSLDHERSLNPITVTKEGIRVLVSNYRDEEQELDIRVTLDVDEGRRANAILSYRHNPQLHEIVPREVQKLIREQVTMQQFCTELNGVQVRQALMHHLDAVLAPYGRRVGGIRLDAKAPSLEFFFQKSLNVICRLHEYPEEVVISNEVQMDLRDVALYKSARITDVTEWLQKKLNEVVPKRLFGVKYIDVLIRFQDIQRDIKQAIENAADAIGYEIKHFITIPDLEPIRLKDPFPLNAPGTFELLLPNFKVELKVIVTARIPALETVKDPLNRLQNVPRLMEDAVLVVVRQYLHGIDPQRFYMRFGFTNIDGEQAVEEEMVGKIQERLRSGFGAEIIDVVVKVADTDIVRRLRDLQSQICAFAVEIALLDPSDATIIEGNFQVEMVDDQGWSRFQQLTIGVDQMRQLLQQNLFTGLQTATPELIQFREPSHHREFAMLVARLAMQYMKEQFGVLVRVTNIRRRRTSREEGAALILMTKQQAVIDQSIADVRAWEESEKAATEDKKKRLEALLAERNKLLTETGVDDEIAELDARIRKLRESLRPERLPTFDDVHRRLLPEHAKDVSMRDLAKLAGLPEEQFSNGHDLLEGDVE